MRENSAIVEGQKNRGGAEIKNRSNKALWHVGWYNLGQQLKRKQTQQEGQSQELGKFLVRPKDAVEGGWSEIYRGWLGD